MPLHFSQNTNSRASGLLISSNRASLMSVVVGPAGTDGITELTGDVTAIGPGSSVATLGTVALSKLAKGTSGYALIGNGASDSSYQGFLQAGTGAVTRSWQVKARDIVSVKDYGAVGNGVADDTTAINAAFTYAASVGKSVYIPGTAAYYPVTALVWPEGATSCPRIFGDGYRSYIYQSTDAAAAGTPILTLGSGNLNGTIDADIRDIQLVAASAQAAGGAGIYAKGSARPKITRVSFYNCYNAIELNGINYPIIDGVLITANVNDGIKLYNGWDCNGTTPVTILTDGTLAAATTPALIPLANTTGVSVGMDAFNITRKVYLQGTVQSIDPGVSVTMTLGQTVAIANGDSIIFGKDCQGSGGVISGRSLIIGTGGAGVHFAGGVGGFNIDTAEIEIAAGPGIRFSTTASSGITNREIMLGSNLQVADGATNSDGLKAEADSITALWVTGGIIHGGSNGYGMLIEAQGVQYNPVDTGARINITGTTIPSSGLGGIRWNDSGQFSLVGNAIRDSWGGSASGVILNPSPGVGHVNITGGHIGGNTVYGISALAEPEFISVTGVNLAGNGTNGTNGLTLSTTAISEGNVGGTDAFSVGIRPVARGGTGISSLGTGVATWLGTPSYANWASAITAVPANSFIGNNTASPAAPVALTVAQSRAAIAVGVLTVSVAAIDANAIGDTSFTIPALPTGYTRYNVWRALIRNSGSTASLTTAKFGVFTGTGGAGTVIIASGSVLTSITSNSANTVGNALIVAGSITLALDIATVPTIQFRITEAQGASAAVDVVFFIMPSL